LADLSQQVISDVALTIGQEASTDGFPKTVLCTKDAGRVILGGACGSVKMNNKDKLRSTGCGF
jgi:hypothetical protein